MQDEPFDVQTLLKSPPKFSIRELVCHLIELGECSNDAVVVSTVLATIAQLKTLGMIYTTTGVPPEPDQP